MYTSILIDNIKFSDYAPFCDEVNVSAIFYRKFCDINAEVKCKICCIMNAPILNIHVPSLAKVLIQSAFLLFKIAVCC